MKLVRGRGQVQGNEVHRIRHRSSGLRFGGVALVTIIAALHVNAAEPPQQPIGYVAAVHGAARIISGADERAAEPFAPVYPADTVVVTQGSVVVCDMRTAEQFAVHSGSPFSLPQSPAHHDHSVYERFLAALQALNTEPEQTREGAIRGRSSRSAPWPDQVSFAPQAYIQFRWPEGLSAHSFHLERTDGESRPVLDRQQPDNPFAWPSDVAHTPGRYTWEVRDRDGGRGASGQLTILTEAETASQRAHYAAQAEVKFGPQQRDLGIELLAARDGFFLK